MALISVSIWFIGHGILAGIRELKMTSKMVDYNSRDTSYRLIGKEGEEYSLGIVDTLRRLRVDIRSSKVDNDRLVEA